MSFDEIVNTYIREHRKNTGEEMQVFADQSSPSVAIHRAAMCLRKDGKRQNHQRRISRRLLEQAEARLQAMSKRLAKASDFDTLLQLVDREIGISRASVS